MTEQEQTYPTGSHLKVERNSRGVTWSVSVRDPDDDKNMERTKALTAKMEREYGEIQREAPDG